MFSDPSMLNKKNLMPRCWGKHTGSLEAQREDRRPPAHTSPDLGLLDSSWLSWWWRRAKSETVWGCWGGTRVSLFLLLLIWAWLKLPTSELYQLWFPPNYLEGFCDFTFPIAVSMIVLCFPVWLQHPRGPRGPGNVFLMFACDGLISSLCYLPAIMLCFPCLFWIVLHSAWPAGQLCLQQGLALIVWGGICPLPGQHHWPPRIYMIPFIIWLYTD